MFGPPFAATDIRSHPRILYVGCLMSDDRMGVEDGAPPAPCRPAPNPLRPLLPPPLCIPRPLQSAIASRAFGSLGLDMFEMKLWIPPVPHVPACVQTCSECTSRGHLSATWQPLPRAQKCSTVVSVAARALFTPNAIAALAH